MKQYELLFVIKPALTQEEITNEITGVQKSIEKNNGQVVIMDQIGMKKLAYEVAKVRRGYYTVFYFNADPGAIIEIERLIRLNENILKFLTIKYESKREKVAFDAHVKKIETKTSPSKEKKEVKEESIVVQA